MGGERDESHEQAKSLALMLQFLKRDVSGGDLLPGLHT